VASDLLQEIVPDNIPTEPLFEFLNKPEIDLLVQVNIKKKRYEKIILEYFYCNEGTRKKRISKRKRKCCKNLVRKQKSGWRSARRFQNLTVLSGVILYLLCLLKNKMRRKLFNKKRRRVRRRR
jgi:hypothetical protein